MDSFGSDKMARQAAKEEDRSCVRCGAEPNLIRKLLDTRKGRTVRMFECRCGKVSWDD
jgi:hypothetical protein